MIVAVGATDVTTYFVLRTAADGTATTGATITSLDLQYTRSGVAPAAKVDATELAATDSVHAANKAKEIDATDQPGLYRVDWPDAAFVAGVREVTLTVKLASSFTEHLRVELSPSVNTVAISDDATAADNVEATYDGTGYTDDDAPATQAQADRNADLIESQRSSHSVQGNVYRVDPVNGTSHAGGGTGSRSNPYLSVQDAHDNAVTDSNHDCIILVSGAAGITTLTEAVTLSKRYLMIRGPGPDFDWLRAGAGDTITITADGIELSGFQLNTAGVGSGHGIQVTDAGFQRYENLWINNTRGDGINILRGSNCHVENNVFTDTGQSGSGQGIHIVGTAGSSDDNVLCDNIFRNTAGDAILIEQGTTNDTTICRNVIEGSTGWGINIGASSADAIVTDNRFGNNASGNIQDNGADTTEKNNEQWAKQILAEADVDLNKAAPWELQWKERGTATVLLTKKLRQHDGTDVTSEDDLVATQKEV